MKRYRGPRNSNNNNNNNNNNIIIIIIIIPAPYEGTGVLNIDSTVILSDNGTVQVSFIELVFL